MTQSSQPTSSTATLSLEDILADLAILTDPTGNNHSSSSSSSSAQPQHPLLSLGRSLVPTELLSRSESAGIIASSTQIGQDKELPDLHLLENDATRLQHLLRSLDAQEGQKSDDIGPELEILRLFLNFSDETLASLSRKGSRTLGTSPSLTNSTGSATTEIGQHIETLHARVAKVQAEVDQRERMLEAAMKMLD